MDDRVQLVFSWDPRAQTWLKERGPEEAAKPPAKPLDDGAVQTYFLDPQTGRWVGTILGARARTIGQELGTYYRSPGAVGLAIEEDEPKQNGVYAETPERRPVMPVAVAAGVVLAVVIGAGAVAGKTFFAGASASDTPQAATSNAPGASVAPTGPQASAVPSASASAAASNATASVVPTAPATGPRTPAPTAPPRTPAPTPPPVQPATITLTAMTADGARLTYTGTNTVAAGSVVNVSITAFRADGDLFRSQISFRIGASGAWSPATLTSGRYMAEVPVSTGKGPQPLYVLVGGGASTVAYSLGNLNVN